MKYATRKELLEDIEREHETLVARLETIPRSRVSEPGVWGDDWTVLDLVAHLSEWHEMFLRWHSEGLEGRQPDMPAPGYKWNETPALNRAIQEKHRDRSWDSVRVGFTGTHERVMRIVHGLSEAEMLEPGHFGWTGKNAIVTYIGANTASHYRFASKALKRWLRQRPEAAEADTGAGGESRR
jgi:hypothetical protein